MKKIIEETEASKNTEDPILDLIIAQKVMRKIENLPSIPILFLEERERATRPVMHSPYLNLKSERK